MVGQRRRLLDYLKRTASTALRRADRASGAPPLMTPSCRDLPPLPGERSALAAEAHELPVFVRRRASVMRARRGCPPSARRDRKKRENVQSLSARKSSGAAASLVLETGKIARQADGAVLATYGETTVLCTAVAMKQAEAGAGFLPADRQLPGKDFRRRQDPGRLLQARRPAVGKGDAGLAPDRPADPAAVRARLPQRNAGRLHRAVARSGKRSRHRRAGRRARPR